DKDDIDTLGILKVDVLALGMLTCLSKGLKLVNAWQETNERKDQEKTWDGQCAALPGSGGLANDNDVQSSIPSPAGCGASSLELHTIPPEDSAVYDMICDADTVGVFQIESRAQMSMLPRLRPRCYYDL